MEKQIHLMRRLALWALLATYFLIFVGGLVRVSGAGLGCPDWPKCFGSWIPPVHISQIPADIDPTMFNVTLAWIEYGNRLIGVFVGFVITALAVLAVWRFRSDSQLVITSISAMLLTGVQGWLGSVVVSSELMPHIVTLHLLLALVIASLLIYAYHRVTALGESTSDAPTTRYPVKARRIALILWIAGLVQVVLGTEVRASVEMAAREFPMLSSLEWLSQSGIMYMVHMTTGLIVVFGTLVGTIAIRRMTSPAGALVAVPNTLLLYVVLAQVAVGLAMIFGGLAPLLQLFHLWLAALYIGLALLLFAALGRQPQLTAAPATASIRAATISGTLAVIGLALVASVVVRQSHASQIDLPLVKTAPEFVDYVDQDGQPFSAAAFDNRLTLVAFMFTRCPGACPPMAAELQRIYDRYAHSDDVRIISISVDPDYDSLAVLDRYLAEQGVVDERWRYIRTDSIGDVVQLAEQGFLVSGDLPGGHSTKFILVDQEAYIRGYYEHADPDDMRLLNVHLEALARYGA